MHIKTGKEEEDERGEGRAGKHRSDIWFLSPVDATYISPFVSIVLESKRNKSSL